MYDNMYQNSSRNILSFLTIRQTPTEFEGQLEKFTMNGFNNVNGVEALSALNTNMFSN